MATEAVEPQVAGGATNDQDKGNKFQQAIASWRSTSIFLPRPASCIVY